MFFARRIQHARGARRLDPLVCPDCRERFRCPMEWSPVDADQWWILARCGACGAWSGQQIDNAEAALLDRELDVQQDTMRHAADRLASERMALEAEAFIGALQRDLIDASDFG
jgi:hypothetical protein